MSRRGEDAAFVRQQRYYAETAARYDSMHDDAEVGIALELLGGFVRFLAAESVLDVGSGTGKALRYLRSAVPGIRRLGIEPSAELRQVARSRFGLSAAELTDGDACNLSFGDGSFDVVCEIAALHHISRPGKAVSEMLRVARKGIFLCDSNTFGQGSRASRLIKQSLHALRLWPLVDWLKTGGKGYHYSDGDGIFYSYSLFDDYAQIRRACRSVHVINISDAGINPYRSAAGVAILGMK